MINTSWKKKKKSLLSQPLNKPINVVLELLKIKKKKRKEKHLIFKYTNTAFTRNFSFLMDPQWSTEREAKDCRVTLVQFKVKIIYA